MAEQVDIDTSPLRPTPAGIEATAPIEGAFPTRVAAIDIGSNAIRYLAAEFIAPAHYTIL